MVRALALVGQFMDDIVSHKVLMLLLPHINCFFFCSTMLFHVTFNSQGIVPSLLLKLEKLNFNVKRATITCLEY
jgi:hypothetical protein